MRRFPLFWTFLPLLALCPYAASAQAMVENALGAGRAATSAAPMKGIGGTLNNLEKSLNKTLGVAETPAETRTAPATRKSAPATTVRTAALTAPVAIVRTGPLRRPQVDRARNGLRRTASALRPGCPRNHHRPQHQNGLLYEPRGHPRGATGRWESEPDPGHHARNHSEELALPAAHIHDGVFLHRVAGVGDYHLARRHP